MDCSHPILGNPLTKPSRSQTKGRTTPATARLASPSASSKPLPRERWCTPEGCEWVISACMAHLLCRAGRAVAARAGLRSRARSEEHTSELQSPCNLVCRLLLEKKKSSQTQRRTTDTTPTPTTPIFKTTTPDTRANNLPVRRTIYPPRLPERKTPACIATDPTHT